MKKTYDRAMGHGSEGLSELSVRGCYLSRGLKAWEAVAKSPRARKRIVSSVNREELNSLELNISEMERYTKAMAARLSEYWLLRILPCG